MHPNSWPVTDPRRTSTSYTGPYRQASWPLSDLIDKDTLMIAPETTSIDASRTRQRRWFILAVLCLSVLVVAMDNTIGNVALPTLNRKFSTSTSDLQWVVDIYSVFFAGLLLVFGNIGDRVGRKRVLQVGLVLFALASFAAAHASSVGQLVAARGAMGVSVA